MKQKVKRRKRSSIPGMSRRRLYTCGVCLNPFREFPGLMMDGGADAICSECQNKREE